MSTLATSQTNASGIAASATSVFWVDSLTCCGSINSVPIGGTSTSTVINGQTEPNGIAVDAKFVYWTDSTGSAMVAKCPVAGCPASGPFKLAAGTSPGALAIDATRVYWTDITAGKVMSVAKYARSLVARSSSLAGARHP